MDMRRTDPLDLPPTMAALRVIEVGKDSLLPSVTCHRRRNAGAYPHREPGWLANQAQL